MSTTDISGVVADVKTDISGVVESKPVVVDLSGAVTLVESKGCWKCKPCFSPEKKAEIKADISGAIADVKADISGAVADVKADISGAIADVKADISGAIADVKADISGAIADVKADISGAVADVKADISGAIAVVENITGWKCIPCTKKVEVKTDISGATVTDVSGAKAPVKKTWSTWFARK
jgi:glycine cleavage system H lipoate-binding protein